MDDFFGVFEFYPYLAVPDDPAWRFYNVYVDEPLEAQPHLWETRRAANEAATLNFSMNGVRRVGLVVVTKPPAPVPIFSPPLLRETFNG